MFIMADQKAFFVFRQEESSLYNVGCFADQRSCVHRRNITLDMSF